ncbi:tyrosine-type recombinase/integrase [Undibacterium umbellatum]|uniref:Tyrosine-type recombinase/integrase n=1 Tax=Undibacterium umbellatum TaxID=2762300 RepID=A0ABR6Z3X3_9BURK|nr:tyrosine-type recombinase/integrase [Undibacterium umbellatum]MBC3906251.1 tyrosine-type recombinase/integrase [Undibacterium umbellatum]
MSRTRRSNRWLPKRVYDKDGAYRLKPTEPMIDPADGKLKSWIRLCDLGSSLEQINEALEKLLNQEFAKDTMPYVCKEFKKNKLGKFSKEVQDSYSRFCDVISNCFEDFKVNQVKTKDCADFLRDNFKDKPNTAKKYAALMRKIFKYSISELGLREDNPIDNLDLGDYETVRREVLPTHEQIQAIRNAGFIGKDGKKTHSGEMFACLIDMSYLCWQRAIDIRTMKEAQIIRDEIIRFTPSKTMKSSGKSVDIAITGAIRDVIKRAQEIKRKQSIISPYLFAKDDGDPYTRSGLFSMWDRARERASITDDVTFKDIRALGATDAAKAGNSIQEISDRLVHSSTKTSEIYIKEAVPTASTIDAKLPW